MLSLLGGSTVLAFNASPAVSQEAILLDPIVIQAADPETGISATAGNSDGAFETDGYVATTSSAATKTDLPLIRVPQAVSVVTPKNLEDRKPQSLKETLNYDASVRTGQSGFDPRFDLFFIRGFDASYTGVFRDGLRDFSNGFALSNVEPYGLEGLTILKGPASGLYGQSNTGGIVDLRSKRPTVAPFHEVEGQIGSNDRYQANLDASGPLGASGNVFYRMTGIARDAGTDNPFVSDDALLLAPALTYTPDTDTTVSVLGEIQGTRTGGNAAYVQAPKGFATLDIPQGDPNFNDYDQTQGRIGFEFEHRLSDRLTFRQKARYQHIDIFSEYLYPLNSAADPILRRGSGIVEQSLNAGVADTQLEAKFETGALSHTAVMGMNGFHLGFDNAEGFGGAPSLDLATLDFSRAVARPAYSVAQTQRQSQFGLYAQDAITLDGWTVVTGLRHDWTWIDTRSGTPQALGPEDRKRDAQVTGRVGLSYLFDNGISPYVSYSTSFNPNIGFGEAGNAFDATTSKQYEAGLKYQAPTLPLMISAAVYQIDQKDGVFIQPSADGSTSISVQLDTLRSHGVDVAMQARILEDLNLTLSYAYNRLEVIEGVAATEGKEISSRPNHSFAAYADYTIQGGFADGLGFGAGVRYTSESFGDALNTFANDARIFVDAAVHYDVPQIDGLHLQVNATNLLGEDADVCTEGFCYKEQKRQVLGSVRYRF
ncbi:TonB-dependent siderophore receptor [Aureimonas ureilytica]|uniref:TonB-dependent siderophore receptor n=1 Tax=Aureimonas ureilytica TaxID=401562 RepID=UPI00039D5A57|nr:TonB-dependent siderophore receptor [Aureimonas ureilytica]